MGNTCKPMAVSFQCMTKSTTIKKKEESKKKKKNVRVVSVFFQGKPFNITIIQVYALTSNAEEAEVQWFY